MSRRVVIGILIFLILGVLGGTVALIIARFRTTGIDVSQNPQTSTLPGANTGGQQVVDPTGDSDADGLTNADEKIWGTNPNAQDTDNDGFKDGEEVAANHNPTIPSPNDKLPAGFVPGQNIAPLEGSAPSQTSFESFFADNVDLTGGKVNLTQEYGRTVANNEKSPTTLSQFVQQQPIITTLPRANVSAIKTEATTLTKVADYVLFTGEIGQFWDQESMAFAINDLLNDGEAGGFADLAVRVESMKQNLQNAVVPEEALRYHTLLLGYSELLAGTLRQVANYDNDQVKALVALRQLNTIDHQYFPLIAQERRQLLNYQGP
ncbi:MAG: hypothetical protein A3C02_03370 [Candidatus Andersenbacteria bacterium RIFCSPHIGHO2_02_FULL_45_11]|uniref:Uncharacterized protein n=1 Tax=Candidatus Andersenbacteria bacterium RIFCSPHIGHO2_12_FULL_45_11 TaxID=1797281 RepID=A0A1G1X5J1_9BACT|nr:MAG: hypothetical protein A2805_03825 [Candidatus Andersenbacteria bacterium RIFCSPHIGHO2_01_FULL_46_36]OGY33477.1 MAG: hypothetical protein A3C02_03370 [Candidatus Andersenbacteria bacterium RIFCSPHIGHO2_02_FULL_45_11]OGY34830.1 MAG: hypothetical protein A3D99_02890 [Candidatus Andersenbacteria bacterium RIFCSPHIGHO2_12_FULL_45_11]